MRWIWRTVSLAHVVLCASACGVTDAEPTSVESVSLSPTTLRVTVGATAALDVEVKDASGNVLRDRRVMWVSRDATIATVSERGVVTGVRPGTVEVAATSEGKSAIAEVVVMAAAPSVASVRVTPSPVNLFVAESANLTATALDASGRTVNGRTVVWTTNNASVAAVSQTGRVTGLTPGTAVITAVIDGSAGTSNVTVALVPVSRVVLSPSSRKIEVGKTTTLTANVFDAAGNRLTGRTIVWSSSDDRIATVDAAGVVRGIRRGTVTITATCEGKFGTAEVRVD